MDGELERTQQETFEAYFKLLCRICIKKMKDVPKISHLKSVRSKLGTP
jgi:hypothetical protein